MPELDATTQIDQILLGYEAVQLTVYITLVVIVVALLALGTEFWVNLWGTIAFPSLTFQRILGEAQWVPGLVIIGITGLANAVIFLSYISDEELTEWFVNIAFDQVPVLGQLLTQLDGILNQVGWDRSILAILEYMQKFSFQAQTVTVVVPVAFVLLWLAWGLGGQIASMIAGNKAGHGISNLWSALPYPFIISILSTCLFMISLHGNGTARIMFFIATLYFLFEHVVMMREHGRYDIPKAIVATILSIVLTVAIICILIIAVIAAYVQILNYV